MSASGRKRTRRRMRVPPRVLASTLDPTKPLTKSYEQLPMTCFRLLVGVRETGAYAAKLDPYHSMTVLLEALLWSVHKRLVDSQSMKC